MRKEIGSEFWSVPIIDRDNNLFPENTKWFISGTSALEYILSDIIKDKRIKTAALPSWCCSCMITPFLKNNIDVYFYDVYLDEEKRLTIDFSKIEKCDLSLIIDYFGYKSQKKVGNPSGIIIRDMTHSIFCGKYDDADYYFGSLRKWAGFWTGGFAWTSKEWCDNIKCQTLDKSYSDLRKKAMNDKKEYIEEHSSCKDYLEIFSKAEDYLDNCDIVCGDKRDEYCASRLDINYIKSRRRENAAFLLDSLSDIAVFPNIEIEDCPLFVPVYLPNIKRNLLRKRLIENDIYCPIHWARTNLHILNDKTSVLYENELSIVCDQRYKEADMERIILTIKRYL